ncbi:hypothetical protein [Shewanella woodyi]|uniref:hypothetical protein n=1 Tax=Shewanella woodyi TaxID=60961 RepID=UPI0007F87821|nr:hypothetical protein [Shewanella woodyi]
MKYMVLFSGLLFSNVLVASELPDFLDMNDIENAKFQCLGESPQYSAQDQKYIDILWEETLTYLRAYAEALTNDQNSGCLNSDIAMVDSTEGGQHMCVMDRRDMKLMVKNVYQVINNADAAKKCFGAREDVSWIYSPGGELESRSEVAQWINRTTFKQFFDKQVTDKEVQQYGKSFTENFYKMVTGSEIKMPAVFPHDISANALPNLWASAGWFPMYAEESERNDKNFNNIRGGYVYAEIFGHWGLLRVDEINGEKVGAEIGMTVQAVDSLYPFHNHAVSEMYYNMRTPACANQFRTMAVREDSPLIRTVKEDSKVRRVQFDEGQHNSQTMWLSGSNAQDSLTYFHQNTIHAFDIDGQCEASPEERAIVSVWARSNAHDTRNDYGTTLLCESAKHPGTPAKRGEVIQCDLTKVKW